MILSFIFCQRWRTDCDKKFHQAMLFTRIMKISFVYTILFYNVYCGSYATMALRSQFSLFTIHTVSVCIWPKLRTLPLSTMIYVLSSVSSNHSCNISKKEVDELCRFPGSANTTSIYFNYSILQAQNLFYLSDSRNLLLALVHQLRWKLARSSFQDVDSNYLWVGLTLAIVDYRMHTETNVFYDFQVEEWSAEYKFHKS